MKKKVAVYISEFLVKNGITDCFMVTGGGAMHLDDALGHQDGMRCTFNHHEQACAIAAEGYARLTGRLAAVCVTSGPGGTNAVTGVMGAWVDSVPVFVLSGQAKRETTVWACPGSGLRQLGDQEFDIIRSVSNMTKYAVMLTDPAEAAYHLEKALYLALHGRGGPVWIDVPLDVQGAEAETDAMRHFDPHSEMPWGIPGVSPGLAGAVLDKISRARAPLVLAGTGIRLCGAQDLFLRLLDKLQVPAVTAWNANDTLAPDSPWFAGMPGTVGTRPGNFAVRECDLLLSLGCRLNLRMIGYSHFDFARNAYRIIVDIDPAELAKPTVRPDMPVCADAGQLMRAMLEERYDPPASHVPWTAWCRSLVKKYPAVPAAFHKPDGGPVNPYVFIEMLFDRLREDDRIICGNGSACVITFQAGRIRQGQRMFTNSGCAAMGYGLPAAVGAAVADNSRRTVCIDGDGSVMMNLQELATVVHNRLDIRLFLISNNGYHSIRQTQARLFRPPFVGTGPESGVGFPDFAKLADAFGLRYFRLDSEKNCAGVIERVLCSEGPCICEAVVDGSQDFEPKTSPALLPGGRIVSPHLEDMAPFLDRKEFEKIRYCPDGSSGAG